MSTDTCTNPGYRPGLAGDHSEWCEGTGDLWAPGCDYSIRLVEHLNNPTHWTEQELSWMDANRARAILANDVFIPCPAARFWLDVTEYPADTTQQEGIPVCRCTPPAPLETLVRLTDFACLTVEQLRDLCTLLIDRGDGALQVRFSDSFVEPATPVRRIIVREVHEANSDGIEEDPFTVQEQRIVVLRYL